MPQIPSISPTPTQTSYQQQSSGGGQSSGGSGSGFQVGASIAASLIPLVSLFSLGKHKQKAPPRKRVQIQAPIQRSQGMSQNSKYLLMGIGVVAVIGIGAMIMNRK